jgi:hypothetical protein
VLKGTIYVVAGFLPSKAPFILVAAFATFYPDLQTSINSERIDLVTEK